MKTNRVRWLIPLFLFFCILFCCSLTVHAVPTAPTSVSVTFRQEGTNVTQTAKGSSITINASATGGSGSNAHYEYSFFYKAPSGGTYVLLREFDPKSSIEFTVSEPGTYVFRVMGRVTDSNGSSQSVTKDVNFRSVGISNTSTISSSAINVGDSVTINASATGGTNYEYYYSVSQDGGSSYAPLQPSTSSAQYVASASCSYKPSSEGNYMLRVLARDKSTGATGQKVFSVAASAATIVNLCDVSQTEVEITNKDQSVSLIFKADKGKAPYFYRCSYTIEGTGKVAQYEVGSASSFESVGANKPFKLKKAGTYVFLFEVKDSSGSKSISKVTKRVAATTNLINTTTISSNKVSYRGEVSFQFSAKGGTGDYEYKLSYKINDKQRESGSYKSSTVNGYRIPSILEDVGLPKNYKGQITFTSHVRDINLQTEKTVDFTVEITEASAEEITRQQLLDLVRQVRDWEGTLKQKQRDNLNANESDYTNARDAAYEAGLADIVQDYGKYYFNLYNNWNLVKQKDLGDEFWMTTEINKAVGFESSIITSVEGWFSSFSGTNISVGTFNFNMEDFVNQFSQIFVVFASSLLAILFGINIIKTALEYQLFTLKGAVSVFGRLILAEIWIQLSTKICVMIVKIFSELMASLIAAIDSSNLLETIKVNFTAVRTGVNWLGDILDFFVNLCPFLLIMALICVVIVVFLIVYIKLIIRSFEIAMLSVISPVFFACSVGEATMTYFKKFASSFLAITAEIVFMGLVYLVYLWYCKESPLTGSYILVEKLYDFGGNEAGQFYTYIAVTIACGIMMIRPPQVLRDLMR